MKGFGIDFGTTNSLVAYYNTDIAREPKAFMDDGRPHPSLAWYQPSTSEHMVLCDGRL